MKSRIQAALLLPLALALSSVPGAAAITQNELMVAARAIGFIEGLRSGPIVVGIVYAPQVAQSLQQARELQALLGNGLRVGNVILKPIMLPLGEASRSDVGLFFLTEGVGAGSQEIGRVSRSRKIPCVTFDIPQVRAGTCTLGVRTNPRIEILVNRAAATASATEFSGVFRIMITEF